MTVIKNAKLRRVLKYLLVFAAIPAAVLAGVFLLKTKQYAAVCAFIAAASVLVFFCGFEKRKTGTRRLVLIAVFTALAVVGRFIPLFKPSTAIIILAGMYLGSEAGFFTGVLFALISDMYFGIGPWTPFQMLAWGLVGFFAGVLSKKLDGSKILLAVYAAVSGVAYSFIMDIWTVMWYSGAFEPALYKTAVVTAIPFTALYAVTNAAFLLLLKNSFGRKMRRIKLNYGI